MSAKPPEIECVLDLHASTGESPVWSVSEKALYWIDIEGRALYRYDPASGENRLWKVPDEIGCYALREGGGGAICGLRTGVYELEFATGRATQLAPPPFDPELVRFNEGACDRTGRFWLGIMFQPRQADAKGAADKHPGPLRSFTRAGGLVVHGEAAAMTANGLAWTADFGTMFFARSEQRKISAFEFDASAGRLGRERVFATIPDDVGEPDGGAVDAEGFYWSALHKGSRLRRFTPDGRVDRDVMLPVSCPTMCAFAGPNLDELYVTSATRGIPDGRRAPLDGGLFRLSPGVRGRPPELFRG